MVTETLSIWSVRYLADDGEVRRMTVEATSPEHAHEVAWNEDMGNYSSDSIYRIVSVEEIY